ncbi:hypothetical protein NWI01_11610 [Nitrobacter winogradskyi]|uniref:Uncharacterized protein n=1 Tax=Nitrobacter winogradskyi TaxID=913 RepID=A0A4Y3WBN3_NITWI|nr:hypothetical protein NWI01_11610 [Nitrobacter winogradskyi]
MDHAPAASLGADWIAAPFDQDAIRVEDILDLIACDTILNNKTDTVSADANLSDGFRVISHRPPSPNKRGATTAAITALIAQRRVSEDT